MASYVGNNGDGKQIGDERTAAERDEGKRYAGYRPRRRDDADIDERLNGNHRGAADGQKETEAIRCDECDPNRSIGQRHEERDDDERADESQLFTQHREDEIGILLGEIEELRSRLRRDRQPKRPPLPSASSDCTM